MDENRFWLGVWVIVGVFVLIGLGLVLNHNHQKNLMVKEMVLNGTDPMEAACAIASDQSYLCVVTVMKDKR